MKKRKSKGRSIDSSSMKKKQSNQSKASSSSDIGRMGMENFFHLPEETIVEILSRLPAKSVLRFRFVCKTWRNLVYHSSFAHMHLLHQLHDIDHDNIGATGSGKLGFVFTTWLGSCNVCSQLYYGEYNENYDNNNEDYNKQPSFKTFTMINLNPPFDRFSHFVSCNGLICIFTSEDYDQIYICNPITRECVYLPTTKMSVDIIDYIKGRTYGEAGIVKGFGYHPSTNEYKVVKIHQYWGGGGVTIGLVQVYTLGGGSGWRYIGEIPCKFDTAQGIFINGALHWLDSANRIIVAFDLADEMFRVLPSPPCFHCNPNFNFRLEVLGGWLCVIDPYNEIADIWLFKKEKKKKNNINNYYMKEEEFKFWSWTREFSMKWDRVDLYVPFALGKRGKVLITSRQKLFRYYPKTETTIKLLDFERNSYFCFEEVFAHLNSFVSLKALGEEDVKTMESAINGPVLEPKEY